MTIARPTSDLLVGGWSGVNAPSLLASRKVVTTSPEEHRELDWSNPLNNGAVSVLHANCLVDLKSRSRAYTAFIYNRVPTAHGTAIRMAATTTQGFYSTAPDLPHTGKGATYFWVGTTGPNIPSMTSVAGDGSFGFFTIGGVGLLAVLGATVGSVNALGPLAYLPTNTFCVLVLTATSSGNWRVYLNGEMRASGSAPTMENNTCYGLCLGNFNRSMSYSSPEDHQMAGKYVGNVWSQDQVESFSANPWQIFKPKQSVSYTNPSADLYSALDEASVDDADYITTSTASTCELALTPVTDPATSTGQVVTIRAKSVAGSTLVATLKQPEIPGYTGGLYLPRRWTRQPSGPIDIDWNNPITKSLVVAWETRGLSVHNLVGGAGGDFLWQTNSVEPGTPVRAEPHSGMRCIGVSHDFAKPVGDAFFPIPYSSDVTVCWWMSGSTGQSRYVFRYGKDGSGGYSLYGGVDSTGYPKFGAVLTSGGSVDYYAQSTIAQTDNIRMFVGRLRQNATVSLFDKGVEITNSAPKTGLRSSTIGLSLTGTPSSATDLGFTSNFYGFVGTEILFWKRALSNSEINELYKNPWQIFKPKKQISYFSGPSTPGTIATRTFTSLGSSFADYQINLTPTECNLITDYNNLSISLEAQ
jgi:hypothetical protein